MKRILFLCYAGAHNSAEHTHPYLQIDEHTSAPALCLPAMLDRHLYIVLTILHVPVQRQQATSSDQAAAPTVPVVSCLWIPHLTALSCF